MKKKISKNGRPTNAGPGKKTKRGLIKVSEGGGGRRIGPCHERNKQVGLDKEG